ncbi:hypothetical protein [Candidatus Poriferisocius sp.]|uniref:hypothetical protein n=1 Tax=Candidatus Poriferisocius sp. TaxID=3101276 RepID=UPI003B01F49D
MAVTEIERTELANRLVMAIGKEATETLMNCIIPEGRDQLATKDDLRVLSAELRGKMAELRGDVDSALARQTRLIMTTMVGFMLTIWITLLVPAIV